MNLNNTCFCKSAYIPTIILSAGLVVSLSACSNKTAENPKTIQTENLQKVELGKVVSVKTIQIQAERSYRRPYGVGVSASSGGHRGIYGSIDLATIGGLFKESNDPENVQEIIVKKNSGEIVAITQKHSESFKQGDSVKIVIRNGIAKVIH